MVWLGAQTPQPDYLGLNFSSITYWQCNCGWSTSPPSASTSSLTNGTEKRQLHIEMFYIFTDVCFTQGYAFQKLRGCTFNICAFHCVMILHEKKKLVPKYWMLVDNMHAEAWVERQTHYRYVIKSYSEMQIAKLRCCVYYKCPNKMLRRKYTTSHQVEKINYL